jgi:uncharacterized protein (DUF305 family)
MAMAVAALLGGMALSACAATQPTVVAPVVQPTASQAFNDTDVQFAQQMIVHHQQAVVMSRLAADHAHNPAVKQLAAQIEAEQAPEIELMSGWLREWDKAVPSMGPGMAMPSVPPMGPGIMPSMMPMPDMGQMQGMQGEHFDRMYLQMMIAHHEDAVAMAKAEQANGANPAAKQLAQRIEASQTAQIQQMRQMLGAIPSPTRS